VRDERGRTRTKGARASLLRPRGRKIEPAEGVLVTAAPSSLTGRRRGRDLARWIVRLAARCGGERQERTTFATIARQRAPEVRTSGEASPADGRRRSAAAVIAKIATHVLHRSKRSKAITVKPRDTWSEVARSANCRAPSPGTDPPRRCRAAPSAPHGGSPQPKGRVRCCAAWAPLASK